MFLCAASTDSSGSSAQEEEETRKDTLPDLKDDKRRSADHIPKETPRRASRYEYPTTEQLRERKQRRSRRRRRRIHFQQETSEPRHTAEQSQSRSRTRTRTHKPPSSRHHHTSRRTSPPPCRRCCQNAPPPPARAAVATVSRAPSRSRSRSPLALPLVCPRALSPVFGACANARRSPARILPSVHSSSDDSDATVDFNTNHKAAAALKRRITLRKLDDPPQSPDSSSTDSGVNCLMHPMTECIGCKIGHGSQFQHYRGSDNPFGCIPID